VPRQTENSEEVMWKINQFSTIWGRKFYTSCSKMLTTLIQKRYEIFKIDINHVDPFFETPFILDHICVVISSVDIFLFTHIHACVSIGACISELPFFPYSSNVLLPFIQENVYN
jgi:hypothetical protein